MRLLPIALVAAGLWGTGCEPRERLNGGGSTFVYPLMLKLSRSYEAASQIQVDYQSTGSGNGIQQMTVGTLNFGCTDAPMTKDQLAAAEKNGGKVIHIPLAMGGVVPAYHLDGLPAAITLQFSGPTLAGIFLGTITQWNDSALAELNPGVPLPDQRILVVSRSDPSGTTAIFADYLAKVAPDLWKRQDMGKPGTATRWPAGESQKGNEGVAGLISRVNGALGYIELKYARDVHLNYGAVRNQAGKFVVASPESVRQAAASLKVIPDDLCYSLTNAPGEESYPISGTSWAVFYHKQPSRVAKPLVDFLRWAIDESSGQTLARGLEYAPLPANLANAARAKLDTVAIDP